MIKINWLDVEINEKLYKRLFIIGIVLMACYLAITFLDFALPRRYVMSEDTKMDTEETITYNIDHLYRGAFALEISGWAYQEGQDIRTFKNYFILENRETKKMYRIRVGAKEIPELQFVDGHNCLKCGMNSRSIVVGLKNGVYDLYILYQNNHQNLLVNTNTEVEI